MARTRRTFSLADRLSLLKEAAREGFAETCRKLNLSSTLLSIWRKRIGTFTKTSISYADQELSGTQHFNNP